MRCWRPASPACGPPLAVSIDSCADRHQLVAAGHEVVAQLPLHLPQHVPGILAHLERDVVDVAAHRVLGLGLTPRQQTLALVAHRLPPRSRPAAAENGFSIARPDDRGVHADHQRADVAAAQAVERPWPDAGSLPGRTLHRPICPAVGSGADRRRSGSDRPPSSAKCSATWLANQRARSWAQTKFADAAAATCSSTTGRTGPRPCRVADGHDLLALARRSPQPVAQVVVDVGVQVGDAVVEHCCQRAAVAQRGGPLPWPGPARP